MLVGKERDALFVVPEIRNPMQVNLGSSVALLGYELDRSEIEPGERLHLTLYWQAQGRMDISYKVFTYLVDEDNCIWGQKDSFPVQGTRPTTGWIEGEVIVDKYEIPVKKEAPVGEYQIEVGMYELGSGMRLAAFDEGRGRLPNDRILLDKKVQVRR